MFARCHSACVRGVDGEATEVEVHVRPGNPRFDVVGLADTAAREARDRVRSAIVQSGYRFPDGHVVVNLAPAGTPKHGASHDLPIAVGILVADRLLAPDVLDGHLLFGELALDGRLRAVSGAFLMASTARRRGLDRVVAPRGNGPEAALATDVPVHGPSTLAEAVRFLSGAGDLRREPPPSCVRDDSRARRDFVEIRGQEAVKRALVVAAAGAHNVLLVGPPGSGKTLAAERFADLLPPLELEEAIEVARIRSAAGMPVATLPRSRPFRATSCGASLAGMTGGGNPPRPGEVTLAHRGVLFLDELPQFRAEVLESLRQPMESGTATLSRAAGHLTFPARFQLLAAMNPCPCGHGAGPRCTCTPLAAKRYLERISGPLLDRIDLRVTVPAVPYAALRDARPGADTSSMAGEVLVAREVQSARFACARLNATLTPAEIARWCALDTKAERLLESASNAGRLSARGVGRVLRVARTVADLVGAERIAESHVLEAARWRVDLGG